jgi:hemoglobin/transferrin/lactoferrin receptor protein
MESTLAVPRIGMGRRAMLNLRWPSGLLGAALAALPRLAAQPPPPDAVTDWGGPIVVTATRASDPLERIPVRVARIDARQLSDRGTRTFTDALKEEPSVMLQKTSLGQASPYLRGFTGFRTLLLVDGIRLNNSVFRDGPNQYWNTVDPLSLDHLELVHGPGSVLYGSDAIGGTVNAQTQGRAPGAGPWEGDGLASYRYGSAEDSHVGHLAYDAAVGQVAWHVGGSWKEFGDLRGGADVGRQVNTGYAERDLDAKLRWLVQPGLELVLAHQTVTQNDVPRTHSTVDGLTWLGLKPGSNLIRRLDQDRSLTYLQLHGQDAASWLDAWHFSLSHHRQAEGEYRVRANRRPERQSFDVHTAGTFLTLESDTRLGRWVYGAEYYRDFVDSSARRYAVDGSLLATEIQGPIADDAAYDLTGVFAEDRIPVGDRAEITVGGRYTHAAASAGQVRDPLSASAVSLSRDWHAAVGNLHGRLSLDEQSHWQVFGGVAQAFRAPTLSDLTRFDIAESGQIETPAPNLDPEHFVTTDVGLRYDDGRFGMELSYYRTFISDYIVRTPTGATVTGLAEVTKKNAGEGFIHGVEWTGRARVGGGFSVRGTFSWMEGELDSYPTSAPVLVTEPISRLMPISGVAALRWDSEDWHYWAEFAAAVAGRQDQLPAQDQRDVERIPAGGTPGYAVYTVRAGWRPVGAFSLVAALENLTDEDYRIHGSGLNEPGRNLVVTAELRF